MAPCNHFCLAKMIFNTRQGADSLTAVCCPHGAAHAAAAVPAAPATVWVFPWSRGAFRKYYFYPSKV